MAIYEKLLKIQRELKAPKNQENKFGGYKYRSCEDILESLKPLLEKYNVTIMLRDDLILIGERYYICATIDFIDIDDGSKISTSAYAREEETKKGMDGSQITGASSSYARKYALNGMFAIDDAKDSDFTNTQKKEIQKSKVEYEQYQTESAPKNSGKLTCSDCNTGISQKVYDYSKRIYDKPLCMTCQDKYKEQSEPKKLDEIIEDDIPF